MKILQGGAPKCGNFWLYQILQQILQSAGKSTKSFIEQQPIYSLAKEWELNFPDQAKIDVLEITDLQYRYRISSIYQMPIENIGDYISQSAHIWTHSPICKRSAELLRMFDKKVYIIRDPRDRAISAANYYCSPYMLKYFPQEEKDPQRFLENNFEALMVEWVWHVFDHLRLSSRYNIHIAFFERFLLDFKEEFDRLLKYLEISLSSSQIEAIEEAVSFDFLKKRNHKHLNKGKSGIWMNKLTAEQIEKSEIIAGPLIRFLGYPLERNSNSETLPQFKNTDFASLKEEICNTGFPACDSAWKG